MSITSTKVIVKNPSEKSSKFILFSLQIVNSHKNIRREKSN